LQTRVVALLNDKDLHRVFIIADRIGEPAEHQVTSLVERTTHQDYYKITVSQGIVIDPRHPGRAKVFAIVLDQRELDPFRRHLRDTFKDRLEDNEVDPAVALQLADIGQVVSLPARPIPHLTIPSSTLALRTKELTSPAPPKTEQVRPTPEQELSSPAAALAQNGDKSAQGPGAIENSARSNGKQIASRRPSSTLNEPARLATPNSGLGADQVRAGMSDLMDPGRTEEARDKDHSLVVLVWITQPGSG
jgi:hypothetical protein